MFSFEVDFPVALPHSLLKCRVIRFVYILGLGRFFTGPFPEFCGLQKDTPLLEKEKFRAFNTCQELKTVFVREKFNCCTIVANSESSILLCVLLLKHDKDESIHE